MRSFSKKLAFVLAAAMVVTAFAPAAKAEAAKEMAINKQGKILYVTDGKGINDAAQVGGGKGNVASYDFAVSNKPANYKTAYTFDWSSSDPDVIKVGKAGLTTAVGVGKADVVCVVTEKATGKVTTLKNTVTVKANAADVVITNAEDWEGLAYEVGDEIDLNRAMYDANGTKAPKRGVVVTDYTRWMAEPSAGVEINQKNGTYKFTEEAVAGEYKLWCETYQSKKYQAATAKSDEVKVEFIANDTFTATQDSLTQLTIEFEKAVKSLDKKDVTVEKVRVRNEKEYFTKMTVKDVKLNDAKDAATVVLFNAMEDGTNYRITVKDFDEKYTLAATAGKPESILVTAQVDGKDVDPLTTGVKATLKCRFFDANGVDVTAQGYKVTYSLVEYSKNGGYTLSGDGLTIKKAGELVGVKAKYAGWLEKGKMVGEIVETFYFTAEDKTPIYAVGVADFSLNGFASWGNQQDLQVRDKNSCTLTVKVVTDDNKTTKDGLGAGAELPTYVGANVKQTLSFTAVNPEICSITSGGKLMPYKEGYAAFYVNTVTPQGSGKKDLVEPFAEIVIQVKKDATFREFTLDKYDVTVGVVDGYDDGKIVLSAVDTYWASLDIATAKIEGVSENAKAVLAKNPNLFTVEKEFIDYWKHVQNITFDGKDFLAALNQTDDYKLTPNNGDAAYLEFKVKSENYEQYFNILVQDEGAVDDRYVSVSNEVRVFDEKKQEYVPVAADALREVVSNNANASRTKVLYFDAYKMSGSIKVGKQNFVACPSDVTTATAGQYFYRVTKDGKDFTNVNHKGTSVEITLSGLNNAVTGSAIEGNQIVNYKDTGDGEYTFELYYTYNEGELSMIDSSTVVVTVGDKGAYALAAQTANKVKLTKDHNINNVDTPFCGTDKAAIAACFTFNNRDGKKIEKMSDYTYDVKYDATAGTGNVFVESVHFYEKVANGEYVEYVVPVNTVLVREN